MRRFHFRLETALRLRRFRLEEAQIELSAAQTALASEQAARSELERSLDLQQHARAAAMGENMDLGSVDDAADYEAHLQRRLVEQSERIESAQLEVDKRTDAVRARHADCEALERLRDRQEVEHMLTGLSEEQKSLDEHSVLRWKR